MDDDEWFFNSFKRYNELQMFDFPKTVQQIDLTCTNNLCVALEKTERNPNEVLIFFLPTTLQAESDAGKLKLDRHLCFDHGYFTQSPLVQMKCIPNEEKLLISEEHGVALFDIGCKDSDIIKKVSDIPVTIRNASFSVNTASRQIILCDSQSNRRPLLNYESMETILCIEEDNTEVVPMFASSDLILFGNAISGCVTCYDARTGKTVGSITLPDHCQSTDTSEANRWVFNASHEFQSKYTFEKFMYLYSSNGNFLIYDLRDLTRPSHCVQCVIDCGKSCDVNNICMKICPESTDKFSLCGFDENVYVCQVNNDKVDVIFVHDGHLYNCDEFETNVRTIYSMWLPFISSNTIISSADNTSVQCWQYKIL